MHPLLNIAITAARAASDILISHLGQIDYLKLTAKNNNEYFTEVDIKAEQAIIRTILKAYPEHGIIAEESGLFNENADSVWIIDPLDGTTNYCHGFPFFSVSIAHRVKNRLEHAVIYDPLRHECFSASRGCGAKLNDRRLRVSKRTQLASALLAIGLPRSQEAAQPYQPIFDNFIGHCAGLRRTGSAALDLAYVASGRLDGLVEFGLHPWDLAAGSLLIKESGGLVSDITGGENYMEKGNIVAAPPKIFKQLLQLIAKSAPVT